MKRLAPCALASVLLASCGVDDDVNYDTNDPYGPGSNYDVNPPADNPTYGNAAYEETTDYTAPPAAPPPSGAEVAGPPPAIASTHTVVRGDTLWGLSRKYGVSVDSLRAANEMAPDDNNIRLGQELNIPEP